MLSSPDHVGRCGSSPVRCLLTFTHISKENQEVAGLAFSCRDFFWAPWPQKKHQKTNSKMCKPHFAALLLRGPRTVVIETTAGVMPERRKPPNLALKHPSKTSFSQLLHIFPMNFQHFCKHIQNPLENVIRNHLIVNFCTLPVRPTDL